MSPPPSPLDLDDEQLAPAWEQLSDDERNVLNLRYGRHGYPTLDLDATAADLGWSATRVDRVEYEALAHLTDLLKSAPGAPK